MLRATKVSRACLAGVRAFSTEAAAAVPAQGAARVGARAPRPSVVMRNSNRAPKAVGPYSHATVSSYPYTSFISGQLPLNPETMKIESQDPAEQARVCLSNLDAILYRVNAKRDMVLKTTVLLTDMEHFAAVNKVYAEFFGEHAPARACYAVKALPLGALVEIEAVAASNGPRAPRVPRTNAGDAAAPAQE